MTGDELILGIAVIEIVFCILYLLFMQKYSDERFKNHPIVKKGEDEIRALHEKWGRGDE